MRINITSSDVYSYVISLTARAARGADDYARVVATEDNLEILRLYLSQAVSEAEGELRRRLSSSHSISISLEEETVQLELTDYLRGESSVVNLIESSLRLFAAQFVTASWLATTPARDISEMHRQSAAGYLLRVLDALNQRERFVLSDDSYSSRPADGNISDVDSSEPVYHAPSSDKEQITDGSTASTDYAARSSERETTEEQAAASFRARSLDADLTSVSRSDAFCEMHHEQASVGADSSAGEPFSTREEEEEMTSRADAEADYTAPSGDHLTISDAGASSPDGQLRLSDRMPTRPPRPPRPPRPCPFPFGAPQDYYVNHLNHNQDEITRNSD